MVTNSSTYRTVAAVTTGSNMLNELQNKFRRQKKAGTCHARDSRRPGARPHDRRGHAADLRDLDLRAVEPRRAQGLRVLPHAQPDALGARALPRGARERRAGLRLRLGHGGDRHRCSSCSTPATTSSPATTSTAAPSGCSTTCFARSAGLEFTFVDLSDLATLEAAMRPTTQAASGSRRRPIRCSSSPTSPRSRGAPCRGAAPARAPTTPS